MRHSNTVERGIDPPAAEVAYDVLVAHGQAKEDDRPAFVHYLSTANSFVEWRFMGTLGFGGKLRVRHWPERRIYVDCYPEDLNDERQATIDTLNHELSKVLG